MASPKKRKPKHISTRKGYREYDRAPYHLNPVGTDITQMAGPIPTVKGSDLGKYDRSYASMHRIYTAFGSRHPSGKPIYGIPTRKK